MECSTTELRQRATGTVYRDVASLAIDADVKMQTKRSAGGCWNSANRQRTNCTDFARIHVFSCVLMQSGEEQVSKSAHFIRAFYIAAGTCALPMECSTTELRQHAR